MSFIKATSWITSNGYLVTYLQGRWHCTDPLRFETIWWSDCSVVRSENHLSQGHLVEPPLWLDVSAYNSLVEALTEAYQQSGELAHLMNRREILGSRRSNT